jgi:hypothetical protein
MKILAVIWSSKPAIWQLMPDARGHPPRQINHAILTRGYRHRVQQADAPRGVSGRTGKLDQHAAHVY